MHEARGVPHGKIAQNQNVDEAEDGGVGADPDPSVD